MLKSEAEGIFRRSMEETEAEFTEKQVEAISRAIVKIAERMIEEAFSNWRPSGSGSKPN